MKDSQRNSQYKTVQDKSRFKLNGNVGPCYQTLFMSKPNRDIDDSH